MVFRLSCDTSNIRKHENVCSGAESEVFAKVKGCWPIANSLRNIIQMLVAVLKPGKTIQNEFPEHFC